MQQSMNRKLGIKYKEFKVGKFESDDMVFKANVLYISTRLNHVSIWRNNEKIYEKQMSKIEWESYRDRFDLIMYDVQTLKFPVL
jgi:hypothetical protein